MPTNNPRLMLTLTPEQYELLSRLAKAQDRSRAAVVMELLETVIPVLERVVVAVEAAQQVQDRARDGLRSSVEAAEAAMLPHVAAAMGQLDLLVEQAVRSHGAEHAPGTGPRRPEGSAAGAPRAARPPRRSESPRSVTRGPGRGAKEPGKRTRRGAGR